MYIINVIFRQNCKNLTFVDNEIEKKLHKTFLFGGGEVGGCRYWESFSIYHNLL